MNWITRIISMEKIANKKIQKILILYNSHKPMALEALEFVTNYLHGEGIQTQSAEHLLPEGEEIDRGSHISHLAKANDAILVLGGDGTILGIAREIADDPRPMLGINLGGFGFLTACAFSEVIRALECLLHNQYILIERHLLEARVIHPTGERDEEVFRSRALNEALVTLLEPGRLMNIWVGERGDRALAYRADGLIVATATGSTGHSLSAGGPILEPHLSSLVITPVSPHSLFNRPLVFDGKKEIKIWFQGGTADIGMILDGQIRTQVHSNGYVVIKQSNKTIPMIMLPDLSFTQILRYKFNLGERS